jgi:hypothetical protein
VKKHEPYTRFQKINIKSIEKKQTPREKRISLFNIYTLLAVFYKKDAEKFGQFAEFMYFCIVKNKEKRHAARRYTQYKNDDSGGTKRHPSGTDIRDGGPS